MTLLELKALIKYELDKVAPGIRFYVEVISWSDSENCSFQIAIYPHDSRDPILAKEVCDTYHALLLDVGRYLQNDSADGLLDGFKEAVKLVKGKRKIKNKDIEV